MRTYLLTGLLALTVTLFVVADFADARGRGGGGRGGGGGGRPNISRGGAASHGSFGGSGRSHASRPSFGGGGRPGGGDRPSIGGGGRPGGGGGRPGGGGGRPDGGNRPDNRSESMDNRQDNRSDHMDNRQEMQQKRFEYRDNVRDEHREWHEDRYHRYVGATLTAATFRSLSCVSTRVVVGSVIYYGCGGSWYTHRYSSGTVVYVVTTAPAGY